MEPQTPPGDRLRAWRKERGLSQTEAGAQVEVSAATWCDWESGKKGPKGVHRDALHVLTGIDGGAWNDDEDRALLDRVRTRRPTPPSGVTPAVVADVLARTGLTADETELDDTLRDPPADGPRVVRDGYSQVGR